MAALPYIQMFPADYLADTAHLTLEEHGAYFLLIMNYWQTGKPLRANDQRMANVCSTDVDRWLKIKDVLSEFFIPELDETLGYEVWRHGRIDFDLEKVHCKSKKASYAGRKSAAKRLENKENATNVEQTLQQNGNHTDTDTDTDIKNVCIKPNGSTHASSIHFEQFWKHWPVKRNKKKAKAVFIRKKFEIADVDELIADVAQRIKNDEQWKKGFIPHCSTYLNGERWEDDYGR